jgi:hypothetical protein
MKKLSVVLMVFCTSLPLYAQWDWGYEFGKQGTSGFQFLEIAVGARGSSMGDAYSSVSKGAEAIFWNPAGIAYITGKDFFTCHTGWLLNTSHNAASAGFNFPGFGVLDISFVSLQIADFEETTVEKPDGTGRMVDAGGYIIGIAYGKRYTDKFSLGANAKFVAENLDDESASSLLFDVGTLYYIYRDIRMAMLISNIGGDAVYFYDAFRPPVTFKLGIADDIDLGNNLELTLSAEWYHPTDARERLNTGIELRFMDRISLRGGYKFLSDTETFTVGIGLLTSLGPFDGRLDYSYNNFSYSLGSVQRISLGVNF